MREAKYVRTKNSQFLRLDKAKRKDISSDKVVFVGNIYCDDGRICDENIRNFGREIEADYFVISSGGGVHFWIDAKKFEHWRAKRPVPDEPLYSKSSFAIPLI